MALDFLKLHDAGLERRYSSRPKKDPTPSRRQKVIAGIDNALKQLAGKDDNPKRGWYSTRGGVARVSVRLGNRPLTLQGSDRFHVPAERATDFYKQARASAEKGEMDDAINALFSQSKPGEGRRKPRGPMSEETKAKIRAARLRNSKKK